MSRSTSSLLAVIIVVASTAGCVQNRLELAAAPIEPLEAQGIPDTLLGLAVEQEDVSAALEQYDESYVSNLALYSLREGEMLQATLQVAQLNPAAERTTQFEQAVVAQVGATIPRSQRLGDEQVYITRGSKQTVAVWFDESFFYVLATRDSFLRPRTLLRQALTLEPETDA